MREEQKWEALERANEVRYARAELKRELKEVRPLAASLFRLIEVLELSDPDSPGHADWLVTLRVFDFLKWGSYIGTHKANRILRAAAVPSERKLGNLSARDRQVLSNVLSDMATCSIANQKSTDAWIRQVLEEVA